MTDRVDGPNEIIARISEKGGLKLSMVLDRMTGAILTMNGQVTKVNRESSTDNTANADNTDNANKADDDANKKTASLAWNYTIISGAMADEVEKDVCLPDSASCFSTN